ncbi:MAG: hypothetical protein ACI82Z_001228 [Cellvibrionaceae bacterium]|jgi:hypothetical protein
MFTFQEYIIAWTIYLISALSLMGVFWYLSRNIPTYARQCLRLLLATLLLLPTPVEGLHDYLLAPAWTKGLLELLFSGTEGAISAAKELLGTSVVVISVYLLLFAIQKLYRRKFNSPTV